MLEERGPVDSELPAWIGPYRVLQEIGSGRMGMVYLAQRRGEVQFRVAIKVIRAGMDSREMLARFEGERQVLAMMEHEHIARLQDVGRTEHGQPYFVMEYVPGESLTTYCDRRRLGIPARLELFLQLCEAVQHAHQRGVIHRDLKPGNIVVKEEDDRPVLKVIDFGLARAVIGNVGESSVVTEVGGIVGTPEYMSPEQVAEGRIDLDTRTDVYALGVILYQLLAGCLPFDGQRLRSTGELELRRILREELPPPPSARLRGAAAAVAAEDRGTTLPGLRRAVGRELDWIVGRAMHKERQRRYPTVLALAEDVQRCLRHEPVQAAPDSAGYRLRKWAWRRRRVLAVGGALAAVLAVALVAWIQNLRGALAREQERTLAADELRIDELRRQLDQVGTAIPADLPVLRSWLVQADDLLQRRELHRQRVERLQAGAAAGTEVGRAAELAAACLQRLAEVEAGGELRADVLERIARAEAVQAAWEASAEAWQQACRAIEQSPVYPFASFAPQPGFVPLGTDPGSGLWEFAFLPSGEVPDRDAAGDAAGRLTLDEDSAMVFVLVPGGEATLGAVDGDVQAQKEERPLHRSRVAPFLMAKFETTQLQWLRLGGGEPSWVTIETWAYHLALAHPKDGEVETKEMDSEWQKTLRAAVGLLPVESVSWDHAYAVLGRARLRLPTEAEWEYCCRADRPGVWWFGDSAADLHRHANLADTSAQRIGLLWAKANVHVAWDDGFPMLSPVGCDCFAPNTFGLHDMIGNVAEWCDGPLRPYPGSDDLDSPPDHRVFRGGSYQSDHIGSRTSARFATSSGNRMVVVGVRAAVDLVDCTVRPPH